MINCTFENGVVASPGLRHVTVGVLAYNDKGQILLVKRSAKYTEPNKYTIPGGFFDMNLRLEEAALKELHEESGVTGEIVGLFHINDYPQRQREDRQNVDIIYIVKAIDGEFVENDETTEAGWYSEQDLPSEEDFAFDHRVTVLKFFEYQREKFALPLFGKIE